MTPQEIEWCDEPPPSGLNRVRRFVDVLKQRPGKWAIYPHSLSPNGLKNAASQNPKRHPGTEWVARQGRLYGRWIGGAEDV